ncbi:hypothetical protein WS87_13735 [Burkholderia sp. MSMB0856]|nr:hypothetical protein WS87_13735 [Burkholderia sp. MSMB0856]KVH30126.1 hypothetical protein WS87_26750 [Burkholderia sp. MSMB0856]
MWRNGCACREHHDVTTVTNFLHSSGWVVFVPRNEYASAIADISGRIVRILQPAKRMMSNEHNLLTCGYRHDTLARPKEKFPIFLFQSAAEQSCVQANEAENPVRRYLDCTSASVASCEIQRTSIAFGEGTVSLKPGVKQFAIVRRF